jgi:peptidoglycan hydrolase CwlO-like protein
MSQLKTGELENYVKRIGEHINSIYARFNEIDGKIKKIEGKLEEAKANLENNVSAISDLKENFVQKQEFEEFVRRLTDGLKEIIPPAPEIEIRKEELQE